MRLAILIVIVVCAVIGLLMAFSPLESDLRAPKIPADLFHTVVINESGCLACHTPGKQSPLRESHPARRTACLSCHGKISGG